MVKINDADPAVNPIINPSLLMEAVEGAELVQIPPELGEMYVVSPTQISSGPVISIIGLGFTKTGNEGNDVQLLIFSVYKNVVFPALIAVTVPSFCIIATEGLVLIQFPRWKELM